MHETNVFLSQTPIDNEEGENKRKRREMIKKKELLQEVRILFWYPTRLFKCDQPIKKEVGEFNPSPSNSIPGKEFRSIRSPRNSIHF